MPYKSIYLVVMSTLLGCGTHYPGTDAHLYQCLDTTTKGEQYPEAGENPFVIAEDEARSNFSIDVDTASYTNCRQFITYRQLPPPEAVRIEEFINYFRYSEPTFPEEHPFSIQTEISTCPWNANHQLARIHLAAQPLEKDDVRDLNLVFLIDVSGSMQSNDKLPLLKSALKLLVNRLKPTDYVSLVTYASQTNVVLSPTSGMETAQILSAIDHCSAGGSTNGESGLKLAYSLAMENLDPTAINRVILCTDGDFNVGVQSSEELLDIVRTKAEGSVFLSILGFGTGNFNDSLLENLSNKGDGNYYYIDSLAEAKKVLLDELSGTLVPVAKDVKIQVSFNPSHIHSYRQLGYENRQLTVEQFYEPRTDAGELGAGQQITALYEIKPTNKSLTASRMDALDECFTVEVRYKEIASQKQQITQVAAPAELIPFEESTADHRFCASVTGFALLLGESAYRGELTWEQVVNWAETSIGFDTADRKREFIKLVQSASELAE